GRRSCSSCGTAFRARRRDDAPSASHAAERRNRTGDRDAGHVVQGRSRRGTWTPGGGCRSSGTDRFLHGATVYREDPNIWPLLLFLVKRDVSWKDGNRCAESASRR